MGLAKNLALTARKLQPHSDRDFGGDAVVERFLALLEQRFVQPTTESPS
jgi:hypothetical protein